MFLGVARVPISCLDFSRAGLAGHRELKDSNVQRLLQIFNIEGCDRAEEKHFVKGYLATSGLQEPLPLFKPDQFTNHDSTSIPLLEHTVICCEGLHRIRAAARFFESTDEWWVVKLYSEAEETVIKKDARMHMNEQCFTDGHVLLNILCCKCDGDALGERSWLAKLSRTKRKYVNQLFKRKRLAECFEHMRFLPGMFAPVMLGSFERLLSMRCDEELHNYLTHIINTWRTILNGIENAQIVVDEDSVKLIEGLVPSKSKSDALSIQRLLREGLIFQKASTRDRELIQRNLDQVLCMIPSLSTFFESLKYLKPCTDILRELLSNNCKLSIRQGLFDAFEWQQRQPLIIEHGESSYHYRAPSNLRDDRFLSYQMLWIAVIRHFVALSNSTTRKEPNETKPIATEPSPTHRQALAQLAFDLGFRSNAISTTKDNDGAILLARQILRVPHETSAMADYESAVHDIARIVRRKPSHLSQPAVVLTSDAVFSVERRFGRPFTKDYQANEKCLFLPNIYQQLPVTPNTDVTSFFCVRDMIIHFLGVQQENFALITVDAPPRSDADMITAHEDELLGDYQPCAKCKQLEAAYNTSQAQLQNSLEAAKEQERLVEVAKTVESTLNIEILGAKSREASSQQESRRLQEEIATLRDAADKEVQQLTDVIKDLREQLAESNRQRTFLSGEIDRLRSHVAQAENPVVWTPQGISNLGNEVDTRKRTNHEIRDNVEIGRDGIFTHQALPSLRERILSYSIKYPIKSSNKHMLCLILIEHDYPNGRPKPRIYEYEKNIARLVKEIGIFDQAVLEDYSFYHGDASTARFIKAHGSSRGTAETILQAWKCKGASYLTMVHHSSKFDPRKQLLVPSQKHTKKRKSLKPVEHGADQIQHSTDRVPNDDLVPSNVTPQGNSANRAAKQKDNKMQYNNSVENIARRPNNQEMLDELTDEEL